MSVDQECPRAAVLGPRVAVLGSINMDLVARCPTLPKPGQTVAGSAFAEIPGGKGANQAVAAVRAGGIVSMIGRVGDDGFASQLRQHLTQAGIQCEAIGAAAGPSGLAMIAVSDSGENQIIVLPGANGHVCEQDVNLNAVTISQSDALLLQLEIPLATVLHAISVARRSETRVILDPAPVPSGVPPEELPDALFDVDLICPNQQEAAALTGHTVDSVDAAESAARALHARGARAVAITMGEAGSALFDGEAFRMIDAFRTSVVDTTAAGDAFAGALAVRWCQTDSLVDAVRFGNAAGSIAASRPGAQPSMPLRDEIQQRITHSPVH